MVLKQYRIILTFLSHTEPLDSITLYIQSVFLYDNTWLIKLGNIVECLGYAVKSFHSCHFLFRAEKVQEIVAWLKAHPVSALSRSSCDLQILDAAIVEKIEEEIEKCKVHSVIVSRGEPKSSARYFWSSEI